jgi:hypothetical protein
MAADQDYAALILQAEKAVAGVKDPDLKRIAFQKILDELLSGGSAKTQAPKPTKAAAKPRKATTTTSKGGPKAYIEEMIADGFFRKKPKTLAEVKAELENRGHHIPLTNLSTPMQRLTQRRILRRSKLDSGVFAYSEW